VVLNVFIFIIEDSFHLAKTVDRFGMSHDGEAAQPTLAELIEELQRREGGIINETGDSMIESPFVGSGRGSGNGYPLDDVDEETSLLGKASVLDSSSLNAGLDAGHGHGHHDIDVELEQLLAQAAARMQSAWMNELQHIREQLKRRERR
jgi:hypothetical protein